MSSLAASTGYLFKNHIVNVKRVIYALVIVAAFAAVPAFAGNPSLVDAGSNFTTVSVNGYDFTPNTAVYVKAYDQLDFTVLQEGWVTTSGYQGCTQYGCYGGGSFYYYGVDKTRCSGYGRYLYAWDSAQSMWYGPYSVGCFTAPW